MMNRKRSREWQLELWPTFRFYCLPARWGNFCLLFMNILQHRSSSREEQVKPTPTSGPTSTSTSISISVSVSLSMNHKWRPLGLFALLGASLKGSFLLLAAQGTSGLVRSGQTRPSCQMRPLVGTTDWFILAPLWWTATRSRARTRIEQRAFKSGRIGESRSREEARLAVSRFFCAVVDGQRSCKLELCCCGGGDSLVVVFESCFEAKLLQIELLLLESTREAKFSWSTRRGAEKWSKRKEQKWEISIGAFSFSRTQFNSKLKASFVLRTCFKFEIQRERATGWVCWRLRLRTRVRVKSCSRCPHDCNLAFEHEPAGSQLTHLQFRFRFKPETTTTVVVCQCNWATSRAYLKRRACLGAQNRRQSSTREQ